MNIAVWREAREGIAVVIKSSASARVPSLSYEEEYLQTLTEFSMDWKA